MNDTNFIPLLNNATETLNISTIDKNGNKAHENYIASEADGLAVLKQINEIKSGNNWYEKDLSHMSSDLMRSKTKSVMIRSSIESSHDYVTYGGSTLSPGQAAEEAADIKIYNQRQQIRKFAIHDLSSTYWNVLGRAPTNDELEQISWRGLGRYDTAFVKNEINNIAHSQESYNRINDGVSHIRGYRWDNDAGIHHEQDRLANGEAFTDLMKNFAYDQESYDNIRSMNSSIFGYDWNNPDNIRQEQQKLFEGASLSDLRRNSIAFVSKV